MKRVVGTVVALAVVALLLCLPALFYGSGSVEPVSEDTRIVDYTADFTVSDDGDLRVVETLSVDFPVYGKHGIFRYWDKIDDNAPRARRTPDIESITRDGQSEPYEESEEDSGRFVVAKIGDADVTVDPGVHVYQLTYDIPGVIDENQTDVTGQDAASMFYWQLVPRGWQQSIDQTTLTVHLPVASQDDVRCAVGDDASSGCTVQGAGTTDLTVQTGPVPPRTPVTVATALDLPTPPPGHAVWWPGRWDRVLSTHVWLLVLVLLLAAAATAVGSVLGARSRERAPGMPLQYAPPEGIGPAQAAYVLNERVDRTTYVATLMHAAEKGAVDLDRDGDTWSVKDANGAQGWSGLDPVTTSVAHILPGPGQAFTASKKDVTAGKRLGEEIERFERSVKEWGRGDGVLVSNGIGGAGGVLVLACFVLVLAFAVVNPFSMSLMGLVPAGFAIGASSLLATGASTVRTRRGRDLWSRVGGFRRVLATPSSKQRFDFSGRQELYTAYVPWAVALGCADEWASKYRVETGQEPPVPHYFAGAYAGTASGAYVDSMVDSFSTTVDSAISSYNATQSSSSGGGGGGGFSGGGGGGGGGGGSW